MKIKKNLGPRLKLVVHGPLLRLPDRQTGNTGLPIVQHPQQIWHILTRTYLAATQFGFRIIYIHTRAFFWTRFVVHFIVWCCSTYLEFVTRTNLRNGNKYIFIFTRELCINTYLLSIIRHARSFIHTRCRIIKTLLYVLYCLRFVWRVAPGTCTTLGTRVVYLCYQLP